MSLTQLINTPCTITHRTTSEKRDRYGNEIPTETLVDTVCEVQESRLSLAGRSSEPETEGEMSDTHWTGLFPTGTPLSTADTVRVEDIGDFEVAGEPWHARNPRTQTIDFVEVPLRRTVGGEEGS